MRHSLLGLYLISVVSTSAFAGAYNTLFSNKDVSLMLGVKETRNELVYTEWKMKHIADHISMLKFNLPGDLAQKLSEYNLIIQFEKTAATEGVFYPPGTKADYKGTERDLIITVSPSLLNSSNLLRLFTHEFFHAVHFLLKPNEVSWIKEGLAQYYEYRVHQNFTADNVLAALSNSTTPLMGEFDISSPDKELYGSAFLYFYYMSTYCTREKESFIWDLASRIKGTGIELINKFLEEKQSNLPMCKDYQSNAENFLVARAFNSYSGRTQSNQYFILDHSIRMKPNTHFEKEFEALTAGEKVEFSKELQPYLPLVIGLKSFKHLFSKSLLNTFRSSSYKFYFLDDRPPFNVHPVTSASEFPAEFKEGRILFFKTP